MPENPKISIIIPNFNRGREISRLVASIEQNSFNDYDVAVVDDASSDNSLAILRELDVFLREHKENRGPAAARNTGARNAKGDILLFLDSDVEIYPDTLQKFYGRFSGNPEVSTVVALPGSENKFKNPCSVHFTSRVYFNYLNSADFITFTCSSAVAVRREAFELAGGFNERISSASVEDGELGLELSRKKQKIYLDKDIPVKHNKKMDLIRLLRNDFKRAIAKICSKQFQYRINESRNSKRFGSLPLSQMIAVLLAPLAVILMPFSLYYPRMRLLLLFVLLVFLVVNFPYLKFIVRRNGLFMALRIYCVLMIDSLFVHFALWYAFLMRLLKKDNCLYEKEAIS